MTVQAKIILPVSAQPAFKDVSNDRDGFVSLTPAQRVHWAVDKFGQDHTVLSTSFGIQSILMLDLVYRQAGLRLPVVAVDIPGEKYDVQRAYRDFLKEKLDLDLRIFKAVDEEGKTHAMNQGLEFLGAHAMLSGIRASQTENRERKKFVEYREGGIIDIYPLLDWPDSKADFYIGKIPPEFRHPEFAPGIRSKGGAILAADEAKTECGLFLSGLDGEGI